MIIDVYIFIAENPKSLVNLDVSEPYKFRINDDRQRPSLDRSATMPVMGSPKPRTRSSSKKG